MIKTSITHPLLSNRFQLRPLFRAQSRPLWRPDRAPRDGVYGCWEAVGKWPAGATVQSQAQAGHLSTADSADPAGAKSVSVFEPPTGITGLDDVAVMGQTVEHGSRHFCIAKNLWPICKGEIGGDE